MDRRDPQRQPPPAFRAGSYSYRLPEDRIAGVPLPRREDSRLLVIPRGASGPQAFQDRAIPDLPSLLRPGDLLVLNDTRVLKARLAVRRVRTGGHGEILVLETEGRTSRFLLRTRGSPRIGEAFSTDGPGDPQIVLSASEGGGIYRGGLIPEEAGWDALLDLRGRPPLPPYIKRGRRADPRDREDAERYQTVYAKNPGAAAAPTAGLHLTEDILQSARARGVRLASLTLHVGLGTFKPVGEEDIRLHPMHPEAFILPPETAAAVEACRVRRGRVVAAGTTVARVLETCAHRHRTVRPGAGSTRLFLHPPMGLSIVDALLTNFHAPDSTLMLLVSAFAGTNRIRGAYAHALRQGYRFLSYGDATFIQ